MNDYIRRHPKVVRVSCIDKVQEVVGVIRSYNDALVVGKTTKQVATEIADLITDIFDVRVTRAGTRIKGITFRHNLTSYYIQFNKVTYSVTGEPLNPTFSTDLARYRTYVEYEEHLI